MRPGTASHPPIWHIRSFARGTFSLEGIRILGVLQRLAIVYLAGALIYLFVLLIWIIVYPLYRKKIFFRV